MINTCTARFQFIPIEMNVSTAIIKDALAPSELNNLAARIATVTFFPFLMIASFEAIIINGTRLLMNTCILLLNSAYTVFFPNEFVIKKIVTYTQPSLSTTSPIPLIPNQSPTHLTMPPLGRVEREKLEFIVTTCATASVFALWQTHQTKLEQYGEETRPLVHPFQFMEVIFGKFSKVKQHLPDLMGRSIVPRKFIGGFLESSQNPIHAAKMNSYLHSFAKKVRLTPEKVKSFGDFTQHEHWEALVKHLMTVNGLRDC